MIYEPSPIAVVVFFLFVGVTLGLSAGTIGPGGARPDWWDAAWVKTRGGMTGEAFAWVVTTFAGQIGAHILAVFLCLAGILLLTGASVAGVIKMSRTGVLKEGETIVCTLTGHGLKDADTAINISRQPQTVKATRDDVARLLNV